ncbi:hypothetical protein DPX16_23761 [Anabarilius grahami]|uniref:Sterile alpha motif domain-containing protein 3 n=1 Tax=Anabarilius grahami TaxID=495550 RepID=A0A3N0YGQ1_ANAGA|nr:hypothetical protein DPX16_23761 [Anabarilius grahami]
METSSDMLSDAPSTADTVLTSELPQEKRMPWPDIFLTPKLSVDVEFRLRQANLIYLKDGAHLKVTKELKHDILQKLAETIYSFKAYPTTEDLRAVAKALVNTHPCLQEPGSPSGYCGWTNSLKDKMGNYRSKMRSLGHTDVMVNAGKRGRYSISSDPPNKNIKKPRKGEVYQEFNRVVGKNLKQEFYGSLDRHCPQLIQIFRSKRGLAGQILSDLLQQAKTSDLVDMRFVAMRGLPVLIGDDPTEFFKACFASDDGDSYQHVPVGILSLENEDVALQPLSIRLHPSSSRYLREINLSLHSLECSVGVQLTLLLVLPPSVRQNKGHPFTTLNNIDISAINHENT